MPKLLHPSFAQVVLLLALAVIGYFAFVAVGGMVLSQRVNQEEQDLRQEVAALQQDQATLEAIREFLWTDEYVEGVARRMLGLVREGESLVIVAPSVTATPELAEEAREVMPRRWWEELYIP